MTGINENNKYIAKQPFIPKTETRIFLGGRPIDQQGEQSSFKGVNKQHYQSERVNEINPGYGPMPFKLSLIIENPDCNHFYSFETNDSTFSSHVINDVDVAREWATKKLGNEVKVVDTKHNNARNTYKEKDIKKTAEEMINKFEKLGKEEKNKDNHFKCSFSQIS